MLPPPQASTNGATQARIASEVRTPNGTIKWGSYLSKRSTLEDALEECVTQIKRAMRSSSSPPGGGGTQGSGSDPTSDLDIAIVFVSAAFGNDFDRLVPLLRERLPALKHVFGCSAFGVMGGGKSGTTEADGEPALSLSLGRLPGVDIRVFHTLRSSVPEPDAAVERWASFVGVPADTSRHVSFLMFSDPRFTQLYSILEGLDYSFPRASKLGGMLSVGVRSRQRAMFAWSADQDVRARRSLSPNAVAAAAAGAAVARGSGGAAMGAAAGADGVGGSSGGGGGGWLQRLIGKFTGKGGESSGGGGVGGGLLGGLGRGGGGSTNDDDNDSTTMDNGMYLYGAVCLVLHGDVKLDTIVSQGYRAPTENIWRVEATAAGLGVGLGAGMGMGMGMGMSMSMPMSLPSSHQAGHILTVSDARDAPTPSPPALPDAPSSSSPSSTLPGGPGASSPSGSATPGSSSSAASSSGSSSSVVPNSFPGRTAGGGGGGGRAGGAIGRGGGGGMVNDSDDDSDDEDAEYMEIDASELSPLGALGISGTPALAAIIDVVEALGSESAEWEEVMSTCAVAVAADTTKPLDELGPADWEIMQLKSVDENYGTVVLDGEVRRGYRIKVMVRDPPGQIEDLRTQLLAYKREDLRRVLAGSPLPPSFGSIVFTDVERCVTSSGGEVRESSLINSYLPLPTGGMFGGAQIAPLPGATELMEFACVIGVLRAMNALPPQQPGEVLDAVAAPAAQQQQQQEGGSPGQQEGGPEGEGEGGGAAGGRRGRGGGSGGSGGSGPEIRLRRGRGGGSRPFKGRGSA